MQAEHSGISKILTLTDSNGPIKTYYGRNITGIKINGKDENPVIVMECGIHAREWVSTASCIYIMNQLLSNYETDTRIKELVNTYEWHILPVVNPDGYSYTFNNHRLWRKNLTPSNIKNCFGVDVNRNWDIHWHGHIGASTDPCNNEIYDGAYPFSEAESRALGAHARKYQNRIVNYYSIHAFSQLWMSPYAYQFKDTADHKQQMAASAAAAAAIYKVDKHKYKYGVTASLLYPVGGSSMDYLYDNMMIKFPFAVELRDKGMYGFALPASQIIPTATELFEGIIAATTYCSKYT
ncbi:CPB2 (predicted) [Pycnogonum litorale]